MPAPNDTVIALTRQARAEFGVAADSDEAGHAFQ